MLAFWGFSKMVAARWNVEAQLAAVNVQPLVQGRRITSQTSLFLTLALTVSSHKSPTALANPQEGSAHLGTDTDRIKKCNNITSLES